MRALWVLALVLGLLAAPAFAQSRRYPPLPHDPDKDAATQSSLWTTASKPGAFEYEALIRQARRQLGARTDDSARDAIATLDRAVALLPDVGDAYAARGDAHFVAAHWTPCADDLDAAERHGIALAPEQQRALALCQARAGRLGLAETTALRALATTANRGELLLRLGEIRIAMGKLDEAIASLEAALGEPATAQAPIEWLLAAAYDRARRPSETVAHAARAAELDRQFSTIETPPLPWLGTGEREYLLALAYGTATPTMTRRVEYSLMYFRRFLRLAPQSPWHRRAEDHVKELAAVELPANVDRKIGNAQLDGDAARTAVRKWMPTLRACLAKLPDTVFEITITKASPATKLSSRDRVLYRSPPPGAQANPVLNAEASAKADLDDAQRCLDSKLDKIELPLPKEPDQWYRATFAVIAP